MKLFTRSGALTAPAQGRGQGAVQGALLTGPPPLAACCRSEVRHRPRELKLLVSKSRFYKVTLFLKPYLGQRAHTCRPSILFLQEEIFRSEEEPHVLTTTRFQSLHQKEEPRKLSNAFFFFLPTICSTIKSFPNHTQYLSNTKTKKGWRKVTLPEVIASEGEACSLMFPLKTKNYFWKKNNHCSHLLPLSNTAVVSTENAALRPFPLASGRRAASRWQLPSYLPTPTLPLSKGISEPAIWELGNSTFSF